MQNWITTVAFDPHGLIPPRPFQESLDPYRSDSEDEYSEEERINDPTTGGFITKYDATAVIYRFVSRFSDVKQPTEPLFEFYDTNQLAEGLPLLACAVIFPNQIGLSPIFGSPCPSISEARQSACYRACFVLFNKGIMDCTTFPQVTRELSDITEEEQGSSAVVATSAKSVHRYQRKIPEFWKHSSPAAAKQLYPTILLPDTRDGQLRAPMVILTGVPLPQLFNFAVFENGVPYNVVFTRALSFVVDENELNILHGFTTRICRSILNKPFACTVAEMSYFLAPVLTTWTQLGQQGNFDMKAYLAWDVMQAASASHCSPLLQIEEGISLDQYVQDITVQDRASEFTNRFYVTTVRHNLTPLSKADDSPVSVSIFADKFNSHNHV